MALQVEIKSFNYKYLYHIAAIIFTALGIMIKGVFLIVPVFSAIILEYLYHIFTIHIRQNKLSIKHIIKQEFWHISKKTIITILFILIILSPELISLYLQFDIHPDKIIYNSKNVSGIKWFFLDSQFGRFFGNGPIHKNNNLDHYVFFIHTFLWSFLPWTFIFIVALYKTIKAYKNHLNQQLQKYYNVSYRYLCFSFVPTFILFSLTSFQLDYYINILLPFALIFITLFIYRNNQIDKYFLQIVYGSILINVIFTLIIYLHGIIYARYDIGYNVAKYINNIHHNQELCNNNKLKNELNVIDYKVNSTTLNFYLKPNLYYNHKYLIANNILQLQKLYSNSDNMYLLVEHNNFNDILNIINNKQSNIIYLTKFSGMSIENNIKTFF